MEIKKIYPKKSKLIGQFAIVSIIILLVLYFGFGGRMSYFNKTWDEITALLTRDIIVFCLWIAINVLFLYILLKKNYYVILKDSIVHHRFNKELYYRFSEIIYIDMTYTLKHKTLLFYTNKGNERFLILDQNNELLKILEENCHHLISKDEFRRKFPKKRI